MRPYPRGTIRFAIACATKKLPRRFVSSTRFQSSHVTSSAGLRTLHPALFTRMSTRPKAASAASAMAAILTSSRTSNSTATARRPICSISVTNALRSSFRRLVTTRSAPARASARPNVCPSPRLAPVTTATCPVRSNSPALIASPRQIRPADPAPPSSHSARAHTVAQTIAALRSVAPPP